MPAREGERRVIVDLPVSSLLVQDDEPPLHLPGVLAILAGDVAGDRTRPLTVEPIPGTPHYRIRNGRHRLVSALVEQRPTVRCDVREPAT
jgi:hypothetical protein